MRNRIKLAVLTGLLSVIVPTVMWKLWLLVTTRRIENRASTFKR